MLSATFSPQRIYRCLSHKHWQTRKLPVMPECKRYSRNKFLLMQSYVGRRRCQLSSANLELFQTESIPLDRRRLCYLSGFFQATSERKQQQEKQALQLKGTERDSAGGPSS
ncbi:hypothetical protein GBF38_017964 [Nibea albiflora]|uniref:Uncharacterized protein n=1 Tax=Nibea albiflora TaxID=240163 RepID=A0ACB7F522_NIBAL|nr:hypothetical protein GBF38_017964 [Nibea albiflora]